MSDDGITFLKSLRDPHWFHFGQISRVKVVEKLEATAGNALSRARHDASESASIVETGDARQTTT